MFIYNVSGWINSDTYIFLLFIITAPVDRLAILMYKPGIIGGYEFQA